MAKQEMSIKPSTKDGLKSIADWYFLNHSETLDKIGVDSIVVCDDGEVFYNNYKGANAAVNHCMTNKLGSKEFKNPL